MRRNVVVDFAPAKGPPTERRGRGDGTIGAIGEAWCVGTTLEWATVKQVTEEDELTNSISKAAIAKGRNDDRLLRIDILAARTDVE